MKIELLLIPDCPNSRRAARLLEEVLGEFGLAPAILEILVTDSAQASAIAFSGSPTIRVDGRDVETASPARGGRGLSCRTYAVNGKLQGVPSRAMIREAIRAALAGAGN